MFSRQPGRRIGDLPPWAPRTAPDHTGALSASPSGALQPRQRPPQVKPGAPRRNRRMSQSLLELRVRVTSASRPCAQVQDADLAGAGANIARSRTKGTCQGHGGPLGPQGAATDFGLAALARSAGASGIIKLRPAPTSSGEECLRVAGVSLASCCFRCAPSRARPGLQERRARCLTCHHLREQN